MLYAITWVTVTTLFALWCLGAWMFHAVGTWAISNAGALAGGAGTVEGLQLPAWLSPWVPQEIANALVAMLSALTPVVEAVLGWIPSLAGGFSVVVWVVWGIGSLLLLVLGLLLSGLVAMLRRHAPRPTPTHPAAISAS